MVPISLIVTIEIIKLVQGYFMELDDDMYIEERQLHAKVFTVSINEELG